MTITDYTRGAILTTTGKLMRPAIHYWWKIVGYREGSEGDEVLSTTEFETEEAAQAAYAEIKALPGAVVATEDGRPDLEYVVVDSVEYVLFAHEEKITVLEGERTPVFLED